MAGENAAAARGDLRLPACLIIMDGFEIGRAHV